MTKTTLILPEQTEPKLEFPLLAKDKNSLRIVYFENYDKGTEIVDRDGKPCTRYSDDWMNLENPQVWTILPRGTKIVIEQI